MYIAAAAWYESATLWAVTGVVVAVAVGIATIRATWKAARTRHKLSCIVRYTALLAEDNSYGNLLKVTYGDITLKRPTIVNVWLYNTGQTDIPSSSFDGNGPFVVDIGVDILAHIPAVDGERLPRDRFRIDGSQVMIGPYLINSKTWIVTTLLVDGIPEDVQIVANPLIGTDVTKEVASNATPARDVGARYYLSKILTQHRRQLRPR
jgi:hypothetical protein